MAGRRLYASSPRYDCCSEDKKNFLSISGMLIDPLSAIDRMWTC